MSVYRSMSVSERRMLPPAVAVSTVAFALRPPEGVLLGEHSAEAGEMAGALRDPLASATIWLPLVRRTRPPFDGQWALPGGPIPFDETLVDTALRTLRTAVPCDPGYLEQLYSFGAVERSADAQRLVTIAYWALYGEQDLARGQQDPLGENANENANENENENAKGAGAEATAETEAETRPEPDPNVAWFSADRLPQLAFDHAEIVAHALDRLRSKTEYSTVAYRFLGREFTLAQLREVREAILGESVDPANFRRQALAQGHLVDTGRQTSGARHRPAKLYRFRARDGHAERPADKPRVPAADRSVAHTPEQSPERSPQHSPEVPSEQQQRSLA